MQDALNYLNTKAADTGKRFDDLFGRACNNNNDNDDNRDSLWILWIFIIIIIIFVIGVAIHNWSNYFFSRPRSPGPAYHRIDDDDQQKSQLP